MCFTNDRIKDLRNDENTPDRIVDPTAAARLSDKTYVNKHEIATTAAYLLGLPLEKAQQNPERFDLKLFQKMDGDRNARIIRNLCILRTAFLRNNLRIFNKMTQEMLGIYRIEEIPYDVLNALNRDGIQFGDYRNPNGYELEINKRIQERISNCKSCFPVWINWQYLRDLYIMPGGTNEERMKAAIAVYYENQAYYPYGLYMNWEPYDCGDIFSSDLKLLRIIYNQRDDAFSESAMVSDVTDDTKEAVMHFLEESEKIVLVVDCENADPYHFYNMMQGLEAESVQKISKILLFIDPHTTFVWQTMKEYLSVPVEEILVERVHQNKSLVDMRLATATCREHYVNQVDAFVLASSDSDFWGLIQSLPDAKFLLMMERSKCGPDLRKMLEANGYYYCFTDMFYAGNSEMKLKSIVKGARDYVERSMKLNLNEMMDYALREARIFISPQEKKQFIEKYFHNLSLCVDDEENVRLEFNIR